MIHDATFDELMQALCSAASGIDVSLPDLRVQPRPLAQTAVHADRDLPPFNRSAMDGYALRHADLPGPLPCVGDVAAGQCASVTAPPGTCVAIATGAAVPDALDTVVPHEYTTGDRDAITVTATTNRGANIHPRGADAKHGDVVLPACTPLGPAEVGIAASCGVAIDLPTGDVAVTLCTSGDEVVPLEQTPAAQQIRNSNAPMLCTLLAEHGMQAVHEHLPDDLEATIEALARAAASTPLLVTTGGISAGARDHVAPALESLGVQWYVVTAALKPGKPVRIGRLGSTLVLCLPGNPVAALVMGTLLVSTTATLWRGQPGPRWLDVPLQHAFTPNARRQLLRPAIVCDDIVSIPTWHGSGDLVHTCATNAIARLPLHGDTLDTGTCVQVLMT